MIQMDLKDEWNALLKSLKTNLKKSEIDGWSRSVLECIIDDEFLKS